MDRTCIAVNVWVLGLGFCLQSNISFAYRGYDDPISSSKTPERTARAKEAKPFCGGAFATAD